MTDLPPPKRPGPRPKDERMTPTQRARRIAILLRLWPRQMPVRTILIVLDRDGFHWSDEACRRAMKKFNVYRPPPLIQTTGGNQDSTIWEIKAASTEFGSRARSVPVRVASRSEAPAQPWRSIMTRVPDPRLAHAAEQARVGRLGKVAGP